MKKMIPFLLLFLSTSLFAQVQKVDEQLRFDSNNRQFYIWNELSNAYDLKESEFENSIIDIRLIGSKTNGYIVLSLNDDGKVRLFHGSIVSYSADEKGELTWGMRSKNARGKLVLDPKKKSLTYSYESNEKRYVKILVFYYQTELQDF